MSGHLSAEDISIWVAGERTREAERHVGQCPQCAAELARLEKTFWEFRGAVREWSDRMAPPAAVGYRRSMVPLRWALAVTALGLLVTMPLYWSAADRRREAERDRADAMLIEQVNAAVSRAVPSPMEPLMKLVSWGPEPAEGTRR